MPSISRKLIENFCSNLREEYLRSPYFQDKFAERLPAARHTLHPIYSVGKFLAAGASSALQGFYKGLQFSDYIIATSLKERTPDTCKNIRAPAIHSRPSSNNISRFLRPVFDHKCVLQYLPGFLKPYVAQSIHDYKVLLDIERNAVAPPISALLNYQPLKCANREAVEEFKRLREALHKKYPDKARFFLRKVRDVFVKDIVIENLSKKIKTEFEFTVRASWPSRQGIEKADSHYAGCMAFTKKNEEWLPVSFSFAEL